MNAILILRHKAYEIGDLECKQNIGRDSDAGSGMHTGLYKSLMRKRRYGLDEESLEHAREFKKRMFDAEEYNFRVEQAAEEVIQEMQQQAELMVEQLMHFGGEGD